MLKSIILSGDGINCERETHAAAKEAGFKSEIVHINDFMESKGAVLEQTALLVIPGGFSFADELGSGKIMALKLRHGAGESLAKYIDRGGAVLGICNGFQVLARLGVFGAGVVLAQNDHGHFMDQWVGLEVTGQNIFTNKWNKRGIKRIELPVRHGEGRVVVADSSTAKAIHEQGTIALRYERDVNGAWEKTAGLSARNGRILGLMPHPEAFWTEELHPELRTGLPLGVEMFQSAFESLKMEES